MLKVMTFNIRYGTADDGKNSWVYRKSLVIDRIRSFNPDLLGLQECRDGAQAAYMRAHLLDYTFFGVPRGGGDPTSLEMAPVLYKTTSFQELRRGCFWLSETPQVVGSKSWDSAFARTATWVLLCHVESKQNMLFLNTHFDYQPHAIDQSAALLGQRLPVLSGAQPVILTGDFNAGKDSIAYQTLTSHLGLLDVYRLLHPSPDADGTFHAYGSELQPAAIDWILVSSHFNALTANIDTFHQGELYPSDHYPLTATLSLAA